MLEIVTLPTPTLVTFDTPKLAMSVAPFGTVAGGPVRSQHPVTVSGIEIPSRTAGVAKLRNQKEEN